MKTATAAKPITLPTANRLDHACKKFWRSRYLLLMLLPALIWYIVFMYAPMYGAQIAFRDFSPVLGITGSKWVGFKYFIQFFIRVFWPSDQKHTWHQPVFHYCGLSHSHHSGSAHQRSPR